jgi:hypothetical protein
MGAYDLANVKVNFLGLDLSNPGAGSQGFCKITKVDPTYDTQAGVDGFAIFWKKGNKIYDIELTLNQGSAANAALSAIHNVDKKTPGGAGVGPFGVADLNGTSLFVAAQCRILTDPEAEFSNEPKDRVWKLRCIDGEEIVGGVGA